MTVVGGRQNGHRRKRYYTIHKQQPQTMIPRQYHSGKRRQTFQKYRYHSIWGGDGYGCAELIICGQRHYHRQPNYFVVYCLNIFCRSCFRYMYRSGQQASKNKLKCFFYLNRVCCGRFINVYCLGQQTSMDNAYRLQVNAMILCCCCFPDIHCSLPLQIDEQCCQFEMVYNGHWQTLYGAIVRAMLYFLSIIQGICTTYITYLMMLAAYGLTLSKGIGASTSMAIASHFRW